jgi:biopolymer transport protein ExbD
MSIAATPAWPQLASRKPRRRALISLTPLIDVVFILLVFFMLASSLIDWRSIKLDTPVQTAAGSAMEGALLVEVRADGLRLSGRAVTLDELEAQLRAQLAAHPDRRVVVKPVAEVSLQQAVAAVDRITAAGVRDVSLTRGRGR